jgi:hypothetical protein
MDTKQIQLVAADIYRVQSEELDFAVPMTEKLEMRGLALSRRKQGFDSPWARQ